MSISYEDMIFRIQEWFAEARNYEELFKRVNEYHIPFTIHAGEAYGIERKLTLKNIKRLCQSEIQKMSRKQVKNYIILLPL